MTDAFDPYYKWLGIAKSDQPPDHYRLLGVDRFESDPEVLANAAEQRMLVLKTYASGPRSNWSQRLLNEVSAARNVLLNDRLRRQYDANLKRSEAETPMAPPTARTGGETPLAPPGGETPLAPPGGETPLAPPGGEATPTPSIVEAERLIRAPHPFPIVEAATRRPLSGNPPEAKGDVSSAASTHPDASPPILRPRPTSDPVEPAVPMDAKESWNAPPQKTAPPTAKPVRAADAQNPFRDLSPAAPASWKPTATQAATNELIVPGVGIMVLGVISLGFSAMAILGFLIGEASSDQDLVGFLCCMGHAAAQFPVIAGGVAMIRGRGRLLCHVSAILSVVPCLSACCFLNIPFGIWALVLLHRPDIDQALRANSRSAARR